MLRHLRLHLFRTEMQATFMASSIGPHKEKRLLFIRPVPPFPHLSFNLVPSIRIQKTIIVRLCRIRSMITGSSQISRKHIQPFRHRDLFQFAMPTHPKTRCITTGYQRRPGSRTDRRIAIGIIENHPFTRHPSQVRGLCPLPFIIQSHKMRSDILGHQPNEIRTFFSSRIRRLERLLANTAPGQS